MALRYWWPRILLFYLTLQLFLTGLLDKGTILLRNFFFTALKFLRPYKKHIRVTDPRKTLSDVIPENLSFK